MALDWNKEVSLGTILDVVRPKGDGSPGSSAYPSKTTMNLYQGDDKESDIRKVIVVGVLLFAAIAVFVKFGVLDQLSYLSQKEGELAHQQALVAAAKKGASNYDEIKESYDAFLAQYGSGSIDAIAVLDMIDQHVKNVAEVSSVTLSKGILTVTVSDVSLDTAGNLAKDLESQSMVENVNVSTANMKNKDGVVTDATLVISLVGAESEEK